MEQIAAEYGVIIYSVTFSQGRESTLAITFYFEQNAKEYCRSPRSTSDSRWLLEVASDFNA